MTSITSLEARVLLAFNTYKDAEDTKSDLGVSWTDAKDLAAKTGLPIATVVGVLGSLTKKDLVQTDDAVTGLKPKAVCLTDLGVDVLFYLPKLDFTDAGVAADWDAAGKAADTLNAPAAEVAPTDEELQATFAAALIQAGADEAAAKDMGNPFPGIICATLRSFAGHWTGTRGSFIKTAQLAGFNRFTAQTQWQRARAEVGADALLSVIDSLNEGGTTDGQE